MILFIIAIITLWLWPFITFSLVKKDKITHRVILVFSAVSTIVGISIFLKFSTTSTIVDWLLCSFLVFTFWLLIWIGWRSQQRVIVIISKIIGITSGVVNLGLMTVGLLFIALFSSESEPDSTKELSDGLIFKVYHKGIIDSSYKTIKVYRPILGIFEKELGLKNYSWTEYGFSNDVVLDQSQPGRLVLKVFEKDSLVWTDEMIF